MTADVHTAMNADSYRKKLCTTADVDFRRERLRSDSYDS